MKNYLFGSILSLGLIGSLGANYFLYITKNQANYVKEIETKRSQINEDMTNELMWTKLNDMQSQNVELARMQGYNEGIQAVALNVPPHQSQVSNIWHSGYSRGLEQTAFVEEMSYEKGYVAGFTSGQQENMKALQNILKSGDNMQKAIEKFATDLQNNIKNQEPSPKPNNQPKDSGK